MQSQHHLSPLTSLPLFLILYLLSPAPCFATNIYVSPSGSDNNVGTTTAPFKTITKGINVSQPGDTVFIKAGTYTEHISLSNKKGTPSAPIRVVGESSDPASYPIIDGGDANYSSSADNPAFRLSNSTWLTFERLSIKNATEDAFYLNNSHYITIRRNTIDYHAHAVVSNTDSSHVLMEYNNIFQKYPATSTWTDLKESKWEGGAFSSFSGAGMNIIRNNYFHDQFNSIFMSKDNRTSQYLGANTWIYHNRFERIVDDAFEPETFAFNNHFFQNTLIDAHRMLSVAPDEMGTLLGPIYAYNNLQITKNDPTKEVSTGRINSMYKVELDADHFSNGVYAFNNSADLNYPGVNTYAIDFLDDGVTDFFHYNNVYTTPQKAFSETPTGNKSEFDYDLSQGALGYSEVHGYPQTNPGFANPSVEDLRPSSNSPMRGKSRAINASIGFSSSTIIAAGADLGAFQYGESDFRQVASPAYVTPPGGEPSSFPANTDFPADIYGGVNPPSGPAWHSTGHSTTTSPGSTDTTNYKAGDLNQDDAVNLFDFNLLIAKFGNPYTIFDFNSIVANYGQ